MSASDMLSLLVQIFIAATVLALILGKASIKLAQRFKILDEPGSSPHKMHLRPTPLAGGILISSCLLILLVLFGHYYSTEVTRIMSISIIVFAFGLFDDIRGLKARQKFVGQLIATVLLISSGIQVSILTPSFSRYADALNLIITFAWVVGVINAFNLVDSADSLAPSLSIIAAGLLLIAAVIAKQYQLAIPAVVLVGIFAAAVFYNRSPAQMFLGDSGTQMIGFLVAAFAILYNPSVQPQASSWFVPITFVAVPIFDVCLVFFSRIRRGKPFYKADLTHTYHRLALAGYSHAQAVWRIALAGVMVGALGLFALYQAPIMANLIFLAILIEGVITFFVMEKILNQAKPGITR